MKNSDFVIEEVYNSPIEKVWQAISDSAAMKKWYFDLPGFKAEPGFEFQFSGGPPGRSYLHLCKVIESIPKKKLSYTWRYDGYKGDSLVTFELFTEGDKTKLRLTHSGLESFAENNNPDLDPKNFAAGWTDIIGRSLKEFLQK